MSQNFFHMNLTLYKTSHESIQVFQDVNNKNCKLFSLKMSDTNFNYKKQEAVSAKSGAVLSCFS